VKSAAAFPPGKKESAKDINKKITMPSVSLSFKLHIPYRLQRLNPGSIGSSSDYFDAAANKAAVNKLSDECYLPANKILSSLIKEHEGKFKIAFSISGTAIELLSEYRPDVIKSFKQLANTGYADFFSETYHNSLSWLYSKNEFQRQILKHDELVKEMFGVQPAVFRNTELIYNNELAKFIAGMGYKGIFCEGLQRILKGRTPNQTYASPGNGDFGVLLRNAPLSDDIAFRFGDPNWNEQPLTAAKYAGWLHRQKENICNINLFFDYETIGIHKKADSGIFEFLEHLPAEIMKDKDWMFVSPAEALELCYPKDIYDVPKTISWEDKEKECCVWCENVMQNNTLRKIYSIETLVTRCNIPGAVERWGRLQSADHFYYMCNDGRASDDTYRILNPFTNAEEAYVNYKNAVTDFEIKLIQKGLSDIKGNYSYTGAPNLYSSIL
jgi:alpha-amylase